MAGLHPVVVITGATGAIGSATASLLARRGAQLLLLGRPSDRLDTLVERLDRDKRVSGVEVDLSSLASSGGAPDLPHGDAHRRAGECGGGVHIRVPANE